MHYLVGPERKDRCPCKREAGDGTHRGKDQGETMEAGIGVTHYKPRDTKELSWQPEKMARATHAFHWPGLPPTRLPCHSLPSSSVETFTAFCYKLSDMGIEVRR